jgi:putative spermidine/putrescine transport system ATP-binding protein
MSVAENVGFPLLARSRPKQEIAERTSRALDMVRLGGFGLRRPQELSGGQQQRVALARALVFEPKLVLMDEPLGALDKQLREHMQLEIKHLHDRLGITVVYVTHDQGEALTMSDRIAVFSNGVIQQLAEPRKLYEQPRNAFVADFIGENNRLDGVVVGRHGTTCRVRLADGTMVTATAVDVGEAGSRAILSIRPENVAIGPSAARGENALECRVVELIYHGDHTRLTVAVAGTPDFMIKVPSAQTNGQLMAGDRLTVGWAATACRAFAG